MTLALRSPAKVSALIPIDNAPTDAVLKSDFAKYTYGMRKIVEAGVTNAKEADQILQEYEDVCVPFTHGFPWKRLPYLHFLKTETRGKS